MVRRLRHTVSETFLMNTFFVCFLETTGKLKMIIFVPDHDDLNPPPGPAPWPRLKSGEENLLQQNRTEHSGTEQNRDKYRFSIWMSMLSVWMSWNVRLQSQKDGLVGKCCKKPWASTVVEFAGKLFFFFIFKARNTFYPTRCKPSVQGFHYSFSLERIELMVTWSHEGR